VLNALTFGKNTRMYFCGSTQSSVSFPLADNNGLGTLISNLSGTADANAGFFESISSIVSVREYNSIISAGIVVFPNPAQNELNVMVKDNSLSLNYQIVTIQGQIVASGVLQNNKITLPTLAQGMYIITLTNKETTYSQKFIKN
jgi:hypothetical protein